MLISIKKIRHFPLEYYDTDHELEIVMLAFL